MQIRPCCIHMTIYSSSFSCLGTFDFKTVPVNVSTPIGIAYDPIDEKLYWIDSDNKRISRSYVNGSNIEHVVMGASSIDRK